ncbi:MAG TPA: mechanosensitive ion channel family protein [Casimicrobiaceae bacterium]|jgi:small-conductance mechanosensitive channel/CRP-like cAMP-binding protein|nr:mechanosensitive ion channel family protein [Casimicrobiaceae bacterium]
MVLLITLQESLWFSAVALLLGLITMRVRPELRRSVAVNLFIIVLGLAGLAALVRYQLIPAHLAIAVVPREICLLIVAIGNIRIFITFMTSVLLARRAVPRILGEVSMAVSLVVYALIRLDAVGVNPTSLIATTTVAGAAIAFAMQSTLGNLLGGISLQLDNTCRIGDWIELDGNVTGEVVSIRWRYTALATINNVTIIIPNAELMKNRVTLLGRRGDQRIPWRRPIEFSVGYEWTPGQVLEVVGAALERAELPFVATEPMAHCVCTGFDSSAIKYVVYYWLTDIKSYLVTDSRVRVHVYAALGRAGMEIPISRSELYLHSGRHQQLTRSEREQESRVALLRSLELFAPLTEDETHALAAQLIGTPFGPGDIATRQGEPSDSLYILARGQVGIFRDAAPGSPPARQRLATLAAPAYFGEMGLLTGQARTATVAAEAEVLCYRLDKAAFESIIQARPELADAMSQTVAARQAANDATLASLSAEARARATGTRAGELLRKIRQFFGLEDAD